MFFGLRAIDPFFYFGALPEFQSRLLGMILLSTLWSGVLIAGMWSGRDWPRLLLMGILLLTTGRDFIAITEVQTDGYSVSSLFLASVSIKLGAVLLLGLSRDIKRLSRGNV